jgi:2-methylcitrate dehydratase
MRQVRAGELSMWKGASFANAARNGVFAAMLAREGMTGPAPIFEGEMGFFRQVSGQFELDLEGFGGRGGSFKAKETHVKYWPAEYHAQSAIWAALELRKKIGDPRRVKSILVETHEAGYTILGKDKEKWTPKTKETADHSLPFIVGKALLDGKVDNSTYSDESLRDPEVLRFIKRIRVVEDPELTMMYPAEGMPSRITATGPGGNKVIAQVDVPKGHSENPMSKEGIEGKFLHLTKSYLGAAQAREVLGHLWNLEEEKTLKDVAALLQVRKHSNP